MIELSNRMFFTHQNHTTMKKILPLIILLFASFYGHTQFNTILVPHSTDPEIRQLIADGTKYLYGAGGYEQNVDLAFDILTQAAKEGEPVAHLLLAKIYEQGLGVKINDQKALKHYKLSAQGGEVAAMLEVGIAFKKGKGADVDFNEAVKYFQMSSDNNNPRAHYALGYMYFKGFGIEQNYEKAVDLFKKGVAQNFPAAMFMLGVCYENGFGIPVNLSLAKEWYSNAALYDYAQAKAYLNKLNSASGLKSVEINQDNNLHKEFNQIGIIPDKYQRTHIDIDNDIQLTGNWDGEIIVYDWSGNEILERQKVNLTVAQTGYSISANWDSDMTHTTSKGFVQGNEVNFEELKLIAEDAMGGLSVEEIKNIIFSIVKTDSAVYLKGSVDSYLPDQKEPSYPKLIVLKAGSRVSENLVENEATEQINAVSADSPIFNIYPNPFSHKLTIDYRIIKDGNVSINLYNIAGSKVMGIKPESFCVTGYYSHDIELDLNPGTYLIEIVQDETHQVRKVIKN